VLRVTVVDLDNNAVRVVGVGADQVPPLPEKGRERILKLVKKQVWFVFRVAHAVLQLAGFMYSF